MKKGAKEPADYEKFPKLFGNYDPNIAAQLNDGFPSQFDRYDANGEETRTRVAPLGTIVELRGAPTGPYGAYGPTSKDGRGRTL